MSKVQWVKASDVGRAAFCPRALSLDTRNARKTVSGNRRRYQGIQLHQEFQQQAIRQTRANQRQDRRCFIATSLYGSTDPRTQHLRDFRDRVLMPWLLTRWIVELYYRLSPALVRISENCPRFRQALLQAVDSFLRFTHFQGPQ